MNELFFILAIPFAFMWGMSCGYTLRDQKNRHLKRWWRDHEHKRRVGTEDET